MKKKEYDKILADVTKQEEMLRFEHFTNEDAWDLGKHLVDKIKKDNIEMAVQIRKVNGNTIFAYFGGRTNKMNENWMNRKFNTVVMNEMSSFKQWAIHDSKGHTLESMGLSTKDYALVGGGFPVKLKNGEMVAVILASKLPHEQDHLFLTQGISSWLHVDGVPEIRFNKN